MAIKIKLTTQQDAIDFVKIIERMEGNFDLKHGIYVVDAKSILGVLSLNLSEPVTLVCHNYTSAINDAIAKWIVD